MKIGIDIDGVLNSHYDFCITYGSKYCSEIGKYQFENINAFDTTDIFGWTDEIAHNFWNKYRKDLVSELPVREFASEVISKLRNLGDEIYIITARPEKMFPDIESWLKKYNIEKDITKVISSTGKEKQDICNENNIFLLCDDDIRHLTNKKIQVRMLFKNNKKIRDDDIISLNTWRRVKIELERNRRKSKSKSRIL